jgi:hypothetical protein
MTLLVLLSRSARARIVATDFFADAPDLLYGGLRHALFGTRQRQLFDCDRLLG